MKKYFAYVDGNPHLFKYAPEDGNNLNRLLKEPIRICRIMTYKTDPVVILSFPSDIFDIKNIARMDIIWIAEIAIQDASPIDRKVYTVIDREVSKCFTAIPIKLHTNFHFLYPPKF